MLQDILTKRQYEVAGEIAKGYSEHEIADRLNLSKDCIHTHAYNLRKKINARGVADVTRKFIFSLENPKQFFLTMIFLVMQIGIIGAAPDVELRKPNRARVRTTRTIKL